MLTDELEDEEEEDYDIDEMSGLLASLMLNRARRSQGPLGR